MENLTIHEIVDATDGELLCGNKDSIVSSVSTNSKEIRKQCLFIPLKGEKFDAHDFISNAFENNAIATFTEKKELCNKKNNWIYVENTLEALQKLATYYRTKFNIPIIGITGSVGKTTTKELISCVLSAKMKVLKTPSNNNGQIGLPLTILMLDKSYDIAVVEMGISLFGEMEKLVEIAKPDIAVMTNIGLSHIGNLLTQENILKEKLHISDRLKNYANLYVNGDDKLLSHLKIERNDIVSFGLSDSNDFYANKIEITPTGMDFNVCSTKSPKINGDYSVPALGEHNVINSIVALLLGDRFGINKEDMKRQLKNYKTLPMRQNIIENNGITVIDDSYNASPDSMKSSVKVLEGVGTKGKKIALLADMLELGENSSQIHFNLGKEIADYEIDYLITFGNYAKNILLGAKEFGCKFQTKEFEGKNELIKFIKANLNKNDVILVKGSRGLKMDEVVKSILN